MSKKFHIIANNHSVISIKKKRNVEVAVIFNTQIQQVIATAPASKITDNCKSRK